MLKIFIPLLWQKFALIFPVLFIITAHSDGQALGATSFCQPKVQCTCHSCLFFECSACMFCNGSQRYQHFNPSSVGMTHAHSPLGNLRVWLLANKVTNRLRKWSLAKKIIPLLWKKFALIFPVLFIFTAHLNGQALGATSFRLPKVWSTCTLFYALYATHCKRSKQLWYLSSVSFKMKQAHWLHGKLGVLNLVHKLTNRLIKGSLDKRIMMTNY